MLLWTGFCSFVSHGLAHAAPHARQWEKRVPEQGRLSARGRLLGQAAARGLLLEGVLSAGRSQLTATKGLLSYSLCCRHSQDPLLRMGH